MWFSRRIAFSPHASRSFGSFDIDTVRKQLRDLYKKVHPDLFASQGLDAARQTNEKSFKVLQDYLASAERGSNALHADSPQRFSLTFYLRKPQSQSDGNNDAAATTLHSSNGLSEVSVTLPPPGRRPPQEIYRGLNQLFSACGIDTLTHEDVLIQNLDTLRSFLPVAVEAMHQARSTYDHRHEASAVCAAFRLNHSIRLDLGSSRAPSSFSGGGEDRSRAAERLYSVLTKSLGDGLLEELEGMHVALGNDNVVDGFGRIWLDGGGAEQDWVEFLESIDLQRIRGLQKASVERYQLEKSIAKLLRVQKVGAASDELRLSVDYSTFLNRMLRAEFPWHLAHRSMQSFPSVHAVVKSLEETGDDGPAILTSGSLSIPVDATAAIVWDALRRYGPEAQKMAEARNQEDEKLSTLRRHVERRLQLRQLSQCTGITSSEFTLGCMKLLKHAEVLMPLVSGMKIRLAKSNGIDTRSAFIDIAWDFEI